ncbi:MarR family winged helix-turn-helix transcriptional regulator [Phosphitispora fastidiosa]|uniref:MarR family winged helix-turn-helix transcriptional regulator n=1 Tax=Phosphitispora fastidiosa TaxID=2837202 RepID=UPI001E2CA32C|nr:DNA-binding MarR family transcriptional regulator [Phosphitispora fastidiosa]
MDKNISAIYNSLQEVAWYFGNKGFDGECCGDLSLVEFMTLKKTFLNKNFSIQDIGNALNFTKSGATRIVDRLVSKGYLTRERSSVDGRVCCVSVTEKGTEMINETMGKNTAQLQERLKDLEPQVVDVIKDALETLLTAIER